MSRARQGRRLAARFGSTTPRISGERVVCLVLAATAAHAVERALCDLDDDVRDTAACECEEHLARGGFTRPDIADQVTAIHALRRSRGLARHARKVALRAYGDVPGAVQALGVGWRDAPWAAL